ncbi:MAG: tRNA lysidine(34) synthetase TilS [Verrucomicrobium sp.]
MKLERKGWTALKALQSLHPSLAFDRPQLVGVSGGRDSVALLHFLHSIGYEHLVVCHVNHGIRSEESDGDAAFVKKLASHLGLRFEGVHLSVPAMAKKARISIETAARQARRDFFHQVAAIHNCGNAFLAHHADDDVETILHHLLRGSGLKGIRGMQPRCEAEGGLHLVRPFLQATRPEIDAYVTAHGLDYRDDSTNASLEPTRNRLRHQVVPFLRETLQREITPTVQRFASLAAEDNDLLDTLTQDLLSQKSLVQEDGSLSLSGTFKSAHPALQRRVLRHWLRDILQVPDVGGELTEAALQLIQSTRIAKINLPGNRHLRRKAGRLFVVEG